MRLSDESFETYELDPPPYTLETTKKELKQMYFDMVSMRYVYSSDLFCPYCACADSMIGGWRWPPTVCTRRKRFEDSAI